MNDDQRIEEIASRLRHLPSLVAPEEIRQHVRERIAAGERRPTDESLRTRLASLPTLPAPPELDEHLLHVEHPERATKRLRGWRPPRLSFPEVRLPRGQRAAVSIAAAAAIGTLLGIGAVRLVVSDQSKTLALPAGFHTAVTTYGSIGSAPQPHLEPRPLWRPRLTIRVRINSAGVPVWRSYATNESGSSVKPKCSSADGATPVTGGSPTTAATDSPPGAGNTQSYAGGASLTCSANVGASAPVTATLALVPGGPGSTATSTTTTPGSSSRGTAPESTTNSPAQTSTSGASTRSPAPAGTNPNGP
jgi:hypothetical protein